MNGIDYYKYWLKQHQRAVTIITRGMLKMPDQELPVPCSEEIDIMDQFDQDNINLSAETRARMEPFKAERRSGKERRKGFEPRKFHDRRGRKSAEDLAEFIEEHDAHSEFHWDEKSEETYPEYYKRMSIRDAEAILKFLNY